MTRITCDIISYINISEVSFSDHNIISFSVNLSIPRAAAHSFSFRSVKNIDLTAFMDRIRQSSIYKLPTLSVDDFVAQLETDVVGALEFAPLRRVTKRVGVRSTSRWMTD